MPKIAQRLSSGVLGAGISLFFVVGCGSTDERLVELSEKSLARQAEQNQQMLKQSAQVAQATRQLVTADAQAREELIAAQAQRRNLQENRPAGSICG
jgi:hypothetical protein